jgi:NTP pyrophosphatase (non-canonical NTP hydrolase)
MEFDDLIKFINTEDERLKKYYGGYTDQEKRILVRTVKMTEEVGELCDEVLAHNSLQRKEKLEEHDSRNLSEEFADVVITALLLAKAMDIDITKALENKIDKVNKRYEK